MEIKLRIQNFKNIDDIEFELKPITLLFGENGAGKSNILKAVQFLANNIIPINFKQTIFKLDESNDLKGFEYILNKNSKSEEIIFTLNLKAMTPIPNEDFHEENLDYLIDLINKKNSSDIKYHPEYIKKSIIEYRSLFHPKRIDKLLQKNRFEISKHSYSEIFLTETEIDYKLEIKFSKDSEGCNLKEYLMYDNNSKNYIKYLSADNSDRHNKYSNDEPNIELGYNKIIFGPYVSLNRFPCFGEKYEDFDLYALKLFSIYDKDPNEYFMSFDFFKKKGFQLFDISEEEWDNLNFETKQKELYINYFNFVYITTNFLNQKLIDIFKLKSFPSVREVPAEKIFLENGVFPLNYYYGFPNLIIKKITSIRIGDFYIMDGILSKYDPPISKDPILNSTDYTIKKDELNFNLLDIDKDLKICLNNEIGKIELVDLNSNKSIVLANEFSGIQQILPVLIQLFLNPKDNFILIEQPELHLHPKLQSKLAEVFAVNSHSNNNFLIETHSEHLIKKFQILIAKGKLERNKLNILYIDSKKEKMNCKQMILGDNGFFTEPWPDGFFDESMNLNYELLTVRKN